MSTSFLGLAGVCILLCLIQLAAAVPWLAVLEAAAVPTRLRMPSSWGAALGAAVGIGVAAALFLESNADPKFLTGTGRVYGALLHMQLIADFFELVYAALLLAWPQGGAVALAAFREGLRQ